MMPLIGAPPHLLIGAPAHLRICNLSPSPHHSTLPDKPNKHLMLKFNKLSHLQLITYSRTSFQQRPRFQFQYAIRAPNESRDPVRL